MNLRKEIRKTMKEQSSKQSGISARDHDKIRRQDVKDLNKFIENFGINIDDASHNFSTALVKLDDLDENDGSLSSILESIRTKLVEIEKLLEKTDKKLETIVGYSSIYAPKDWK